MIVARSFDPTSGQLAENTVEVAGPIAFTGGLGFGSFSVSSTEVIAYTAGTASVATTGISWLDRQGRPLGVLAAGTDLSSYNSYSVRLSPDGRWAVLSTFPSATRHGFGISLDHNLSAGAHAYQERRKVVRCFGLRHANRRLAHQLQL